MSTIKIGDYVIINDADKPCTRLIAKAILVEPERGFIRARYICEQTNMRECQGRLSNATLVSDFGVDLAFEGNTVTATQPRPSVARYPDGEPRDWQPSGENPTQTLYRAKKKR